MNTHRIGTHTRFEYSWRKTFSVILGKPLIWPIFSPQESTERKLLQMISRKHRSNRQTDECWPTLYLLSTSSMGATKGGRRRTQTEPCPGNTLKQPRWNGISSIASYILLYTYHYFLCIIPKRFIDDLQLSLLNTWHKLNYYDIFDEPFYFLKLK